MYRTIRFKRIFFDKIESLRSGKGSVFSIHSVNLCLSVFAALVCVCVCVCVFRKCVWMCSSIVSLKVADLQTVRVLDSLRYRSDLLEVIVLCCGSRAKAQFC